MKRIVVAAKAGAEQPWLADAAAELAEQIGADVAVVSLDGMEMEALSTVPRSELARDAQSAAAQVAERIGRAGITATAEHRSGPVVRGEAGDQQAHGEDEEGRDHARRGDLGRLGDEQDDDEERP